jgi:hypothetical protein
VMRPLRVTLVTRPSMIAPSYCEGWRTVIVKRSPTCVDLVVRSVLSVATSVSPFGMMKSPLPVVPTCVGKLEPPL